MTIKLIALDMDGTLLNRQKLVSQKNALAVKQAMDKGIFVTIATGRMPASASYFAKQLKMNCPVISCNGGVVKSLDTDKIIYEAHFPKNTIKTLITMCYAKNWYIRWYIGNTIYVRYIDMNMFPAYKTTKGLNIVEVGENFNDYLENVTQIVVCNFEGKIQQIYEEIASTFGNRIGLQQNTGYTMDITPPGITKSVGLSKLAEYLNIKREEIMACGDGDNDLTMIKYAGIGVAMENAIDDVKNVAQFITKDCDEDGIAYAIEKYL